MRVLLINGSPREKGCTYTALLQVKGALEKNGVGAEIFWLGSGAIQGCTSCYACKAKPFVCPYDKVKGDKVAEFITKAKEADGFVFGSPVYYAGPNGSLTAFMDRAFFAYSAHLKGKPAACVVSARRSGTTATVDRLNKYFLINQMPIVSANYWNAVHGSEADEVLKDAEGIQTMRIIGANMAWLIKCIKAGEPFKEAEPKTFTNFIRE
ncbi:MAG: flavodoxin family protein [Firmicutes bacterium]|nr:flavodoxin family protein [Bacillota bacterium]